MKSRKHGVGRVVTGRYWIYQHGSWDESSSELVWVMFEPQCTTHSSLIVEDTVFQNQCNTIHKRTMCQSLFLLRSKFWTRSSDSSPLM